MPRADYAAGIDTFTLIVIVGLVLMVLAVLALGPVLPRLGRRAARLEADALARGRGAERDRRRRADARGAERAAAPARAAGAHGGGDRGRGAPRPRRVKERAAAFRAREGHPPRSRVARVLIVALRRRAGRRWRASCVAAGHAVRGTTRGAARGRRDRRGRRGALRRRPRPHRDADGGAARRDDRVWLTGTIADARRCTPGGCGCCARSSSTRPCAASSTRACCRRARRSRARVVETWQIPLEVLDGDPLADDWVTRSGRGCGPAPSLNSRSPRMRAVAPQTMWPSTS